jgi:uncharacterized protein (TIGR03083 family)
MAMRPLRQYYATADRAPLPVADGPDELVAPWRAHRERFLTAVRALDASDWDHGTRCSEWSVRDVVAHLVTVDGFWPLVLATARDGAAPTTYLAGFDPSRSPDEFVQATTAGVSTAELVERHVDALDALEAVVASLDAAAWNRRCESPLGHLPAQLILAHGYWDSWLHEFDIFAPLGRAPAVDHDDLVVVTWFSLVFAALQGGLVDDPDAVGPGPASPIEACLAFSDLPGQGFHFTVGTIADGVGVGPCGPDHAPGEHGRALDLVEGLTGRRPTDEAIAALPRDVAAQVRRAAQTL